MKYIGTKEKGMNNTNSTNLGDIYTKLENGLYQLNNLNIFFTEKEILHDLNKGYLKEYKQI